MLQSCRSASTTPWTPLRLHDWPARRQVTDQARRQGVPRSAYGIWQGALVRSLAGLVDALNRHRGKGQQVVRVEHVTARSVGRRSSVP